MSKLQTVFLIGSGNVATCLGKELLKKGFDIKGVHSYNFGNAQICASTLKTTAYEHIGTIPQDCDIYILAVKDSVIKNICDQIHTKNLVVHTAGSVSMDDLICHKNRGVLYPLQTFTKQFELDFKEIPFLIEASNPESMESLKAFSQSLSDKVLEVSTKDRKVIHIGAVFVNNFINYMLLNATELANQNDFDFQLYKSLATETIRKAFELGPLLAQTGPAKRADFETINSHLDELKIQNNAEISEIYELITNQIWKRFNP